MSAYPLLTPGAARPKSFYQYQWAGHEWDDLSDRSKLYNISMPDGDTLRLELREGDQSAFDVSAKSGSERCELGASYDGMYQKPPGVGRVPIETPTYVSYGLTIEPGPVNTASWLVLAQFHEDQVSGSPPISICLAAKSDVMTINKGWTDAGGKNVNGPIWTDTTPLVRGRRYQMTQWMTVDPSGNGRLVVYRDGVKLIDHAGPIGYAKQTNSFWKVGPYRHGPTPETIAVRYDHMSFGWGERGIPAVR